MLYEFAVLVGSNASILLAPIFVLQGALVRKQMPKIPGAAGEHQGTVLAGHSSVRLLFLGESTVEGVGAPTYQEALVGQSAQSLAQATNRTVHWHAVGKSGATVQRTIQQLLPQVPDEPFDVAVIALGVNDVLRFHQPARFQREMAMLVSQLRSQIGAIPVVLAAVPAVGRFPGLPQPLRSGLGLRAHAFNIALQRLASSMPKVTVVVTAIDNRPELFCEDNFHPSVIGYQHWGRQLAGAIETTI